jgi:hypothetical protein
LPQLGDPEDEQSRAHRGSQPGQQLQLSQQAKPPSGIAQQCGGMEDRAQDRTLDDE